MFRDPISSTNPLLIDLPLAPGGAVKGQTSTAAFLGLDRFSLWMAKVAVVDFIAVVLASFVTSAIYHGISGPELFYAPRYATASVVIATLYLLASLVFNDYRKLQQQRYQQFLRSGLKSVAIALAFFLSGMFVLKIADDYSRATFIFQIGGICLTVLAVRSLIFSRMKAAIATQRIEGRRAILIGDPVYYNQFSRRLQSCGVRTVECHTFASFDLHSPLGMTRMVDSCRDLHPDDVLILAKPAELPQVSHLVDALSRLPVAVHLVPVEIGQLLSLSQIAGLGDVVTVQVLRPPLSALDIFVKRLFDIVAASIGLLVFSPMFLLVAAAIKLDSAGPVFFRQERHGYNNRTISVFKFRSMTTSQGETEFKQTQRDDPRVTRIGRIIRRTSIDELPQLLNVLRGEMSIVGPRPHATVHNEMFEGRIFPLSRRHNVKPGITGWAQVNRSRGETDTLEKMQTRIDLDLYYVDNWSFFFDMKIILMTFSQLFSGKEYVY